MKQIPDPPHVAAAHIAITASKDRLQQAVQDTPLEVINCYFDRAPMVREILTDGQFRNILWADDALGRLLRDMS